MYCNFWHTHGNSLGTFTFVSVGVLPANDLPIGLFGIRDRCAEVSALSHVSCLWLLHAYAKAFRNGLDVCYHAVLPETDESYIQ